MPFTDVLPCHALEELLLKMRCQLMRGVAQKENPFMTTLPAAETAI
jgi:hypothetical protein